MSKNPRRIPKFPAPSCSLTDPENPHDEECGEEPAKKNTVQEDHQHQHASVSANSQHKNKQYCVTELHRMNRREEVEVEVEVGVEGHQVEKDGAWNVVLDVAAEEATTRLSWHSWGE